MAKEEKGIKLIGGPSPFVVRVMIALNLKDIEYEYIEENMLNKSEFLLNNNPIYKKIPVLIHGNKPVCESLIILQYIEETWANSTFSILPSDPYNRAISRFWANYVDDKLVPQIGALIWSDLENKKDEAKEQLFNALLQLEDVLVKSNNEKNFFGGDIIDLVDIAFGSCLSWLQALNIITGENFLDRTKTPRIVEWADQFRSAAAAKNVLPEAEKLVEFWKLVRSAVDSPSK